MRSTQVLTIVDFETMLDLKFPCKDKTDMGQEVLVLLHLPGKYLLDSGKSNNVIFLKQLGNNVCCLLILPKTVTANHL